MASYYNAMTYIPEPDRSKLIEAVLRYGLFDEEPNLPDNLMGFWMLIEPTLKSSVGRYAANVSNGKKGGAPKGNQNARKHPKKGNNPETTQKQPKNNLNKDKDMDKDRAMDKDKEMDTRPAGPDSRSRPCKDMDKESSLTTNIDIEAEEGWEKQEQSEREKMFLSRFKPPEDLSGYTEEELEEERQTKLQALQKFREEAKK